ncbi:polysaccharide biosynthesis tyrosine autokinase [Hyphomicrobium sp.]|uniref:polysaccharide biosynthesis tyrosine autokinase n=1 Tax=Hyphomicrobium sp. TaxID=82 RepID=UPI000FAF810E|nr:polysaccharide biosynthesis tyrosine autokinase [Hyphomicrobium sp.]RUP08190.1 MAG: lipopolysaccharide biosynthesis protein [Hyphomicrobium sp.]
MNQQAAPTARRGTRFGLSGARSAVVKRARAVACVPLAAALIAAAIVAVIPDRYVASTMIQTDPLRKAPTPAVEEDDAALSDTLASEAERKEIETQMDFLRSASILDAVIAELHLADDPEFNKRSMLSRLMALFHSPAPGEELRSAILNQLSISRVRSTFLVYVQFTSSDGAKSARIANAIANQFLAQRPSPIAKAAVAVSKPGELTASERMFSSLIEKYGSAVTFAGPRIVNMASPPARAAGPKRIRIVAITGGSALLLTIMLALWLEREALLRTRKVEKTLACPHMISIPAMAPPSDPLAGARGARMIVAEPQGIYADAVRKVCNELGQRKSEENEHETGRVILVASALPDEGSEIFASNIAHYFAVSALQTLLVDCDFRGKGLTRELTPQISGGLLNQIAARAPIEDAILRDCLTGLHFLPASGPAPVPLAVPTAIRSAEFSSAIAGLKSRFPIIVLSAPPLLPISDARVLAELADDIVFLTAWHRTPQSLARKALTLLEANQKKVVGAVLTDVAEDQATGIMSFAAIFDEIRRAARISTIERAA